jgi:hypothetical protein
MRGSLNKVSPSVDNITFTCWLVAKRHDNVE